MTQLQWQDKVLTLNISEHRGIQWLSLDGLVAALGGHLRELPGGALGFCLSDDRCLPLRSTDLREEGTGRYVRLSALTPIGLTADEMSAVDGILLGDPLPDITLPDLDGSSFMLRDLQGKPSLLFAWASW